jgi:hypothetical protein
MLSVRNTLLAKMWRLCRPSEAPTPPPISVGRPTEKNLTISTKEKIRRRNFKKIIQGAVFSDWTHASFTGTGVKSEPAQLSFYARNRFELWRKLPPIRIRTLLVCLLFY